MVYVPQDIVDLIVDQLHSTALYCGNSLRATSLVSTAWVNPSQRRLFATLHLYSSSAVQRWCSRIRPGPHGISRHVRVLRLSSQLVVSGILETALPHFASFQNLRELDIAGEAVRQNRIRIDVLVPLLSSSAGTLKRLQCTQDFQKGAPRDSTWESLYALANSLPNLTGINLSNVQIDPLTPPCARPCIHLSPGYQLPDLFAFKHIEFQKLVVIDPIPPSPRFLEYCQHHLRVLDFTNNWYFTHEIQAPSSQYLC